MRPYPYPLRWRLPYGVWTCADGALVAFDRLYDPIAQKYPEQPAALIEPENWINYESTEYLYDDGTPENVKLRQAKKLLNTWKIFEEAYARAKILRKIPHKIARNH